MSAGAFSNLGGREVSKEKQGRENSECGVLESSARVLEGWLPFLLVLMGSAGTRDPGDEGRAAAMQQSKARWSPRLHRLTLQHPRHGTKLFPGSVRCVKEYRARRPADKPRPATSVLVTVSKELQGTLQVQARSKIH